MFNMRCTYLLMTLNIDLAGTAAVYGKYIIGT